jgi:hypothetical protein
MTLSRIVLMAGVVASIVAAQPANAAFINGSFANPDLGGAPYLELNVGDTLPGWKIEAGNIDIQSFGQFGVPADPNSSSSQYVDLNGDRPGTISQVMQATAGTTFKLSFDFSGGVDTGFGDSSGNSLVYQLFDGSTGKTILQGSELIQQSNLLNWTNLSVQATATSSLLGVRFWSDGRGADGYFGPYLGAVSLTQVSGAVVPEPSTLSLGVIGGLLSLAFYVRKR